MNLRREKNLFWLLFLLTAILRITHAQDAADADKNAVAIEALSRLEGIDLDQNPGVKKAVLKILDRTRGTAQFVQIVRQFKLNDQEPGLLEVAARNPSSEAGVDAMRLVLAHHDFDLIKNSLLQTNAPLAAGTAEALGNTGEKEIIPLLLPLVSDSKHNPALRKQAVRSLARLENGATALLNLAREDKLPDDLKFVTGAELNAARWPAIKTEAAKVLPLPQGQNAPLPPLAELLKMNGNPVNGETVFFRETSACSSCHKINGRGAEVGPNLSEIGAKLGKDALIESILDPSAGISMGFEAWQIELKNGDESFGLIASETPDELAIKDTKGIVTRFKKSDVLKREQQKISIMPAGLQATMSTEEFVDLLEFLASSKKAAN